MIRGLIKLGTLALAGFAVYSIYDMVAHGACAKSEGGGAAAAGPFGESTAEDTTTVGGARMTAGGHGRAEMTQDARGTMASHRVGRGVVCGGRLIWVVASGLLT